MKKERLSLPAAPGFVSAVNNPRPSWPFQNFCWGYAGQPCDSPNGQDLSPFCAAQADIPAAAQLANRYSGADGPVKGRKENRHQTGEPTTIFFRNVPNNYSGKRILELLDKSGFQNGYDFVYVPHDFKRLPSLVNLGYFFVNFTDHANAVKALEEFEGFNDWSMDSSKVLAASWATQTQGQKACIKRYRNCPVMHETVPVECKPMIFVDGEMVAFGPSKKKIKQPRFKKGLFPELGDDLAGEAQHDPANDIRVEYVEAEEDGLEEEEGASEDASNTLEEMGVQSSTSMVWMPDESACSCSVCEEPFTMFRRRHHCRACGLVCCAECAPRTSSAWPSLLRRAQTTYKRLCKDCAQGLPSSPLSPTVLQTAVKNTFIDIKEGPPVFTHSRLADSFPF